MKNTSPNARERVRKAKRATVERPPTKTGYQARVRACVAKCRSAGRQIRLPAGDEFVIVVTGARPHRTAEHLLRSADARPSRGR
jgi:hypothetical protein